MSIVPESIPGSISYFENQLTVWASNAEAIGIDAAQATQIAALTMQAREAYNTALTAREAAKAATLAQSDAVDAMRAFGGDLIKTIRAFAETTDDPGVFVTAQVPAPKPRTPLGPAPTPENVAVNLTSAGGISLSWMAETRGRIGFIIERRTATPGEQPTAWSIVGTSTTKTFIDDTLPTGLATAQYRVFAERPGGRSLPTDPVSVLFGTGGQAGGGDLRIAA